MVEEAWRKGKNKSEASRVGTSSTYPFGRSFGERTGYSSPGTTSHRMHSSTKLSVKCPRRAQKDQMSSWVESLEGHKREEIFMYCESCSTLEMGVT